LRLAQSGDRRPYLLSWAMARSALGGGTRGTGQAGDIRFLGFRNQSELPRFYDLADVFVLASVDEPWGLSINEVMNAGRPVIVSDQVGCHRDLVHPGVNGSVIPAKTSKPWRQASRPSSPTSTGRRPWALKACVSLRSIASNRMWQGCARRSMQFFQGFRENRRVDAALEGYGGQFDMRWGMLPQVTWITERKTSRGRLGSCCEALSNALQWPSSLWG